MTRPAGSGAGESAVGVCAERLWLAVLDGDEPAAAAAVLGAVDAGLDREVALLDVVGAVQGRVGMAWAANEITVAQEHAATAINDRVVAALALATAHGEPTRGRVTVACVDGEWHALPARLLAEVLTLRGFAVDYLGAQVPSPHLIAHLHRTGPDTVALSGSIATRLPAAHATITACHAAGTPVIVGGAAFGPDGRYAHRLGADAWAPDARTAAVLLADGLPPQPLPVRQQAEELAHLADQEFTMVSRSTPQLVKAALAGLEQRLPEVAADDRQREQTGADLVYLVEFLATALYVDDPELFTGFVDWMAQILTARGAPAALLRPTLDLLTAELRDFPRAGAMLAAARPLAPISG